MPRRGSRRCSRSGIRFFPVDNHQLADTPATRNPRSYLRRSRVGASQLARMTKVTPRPSLAVRHRAVTGAPHMQIGVITNPNSRKNKGRPDRARRLQSIVGDLGEVHATNSVESIKPVLREFLRKKAQYWVADGGDGALHWMLRLGMEVLQEEEFADQSSLPLTMPTNGGTIDFIANNVGIRG